jgi:hypothetical protein
MDEVFVWTQDRVDLLKLRVAAGWTGGQIGRELGVTCNAVIGKIARLKIESMRPPRLTAKEAQGAAARRLLAVNNLATLLKALNASQTTLTPDFHRFFGHVCGFR